MPRDPLPAATPGEAAGAAPGPLPQAHRRASLRVTAWLLVLWFFVSFALVFFARDLDFDFFGWPFGYWVAAQGSLLAYLAIAAFYAGFMRRLDARHGVDDRPADPTQGMS